MKTWGKRIKKGGVERTHWTAAESSTIACIPTCRVGVLDGFAGHRVGVNATLCSREVEVRVDPVRNDVDSKTSTDAEPEKGDGGIVG